jgi:alginate O-acetyltransferase complex protein AlgI
MPTYFWTWTLTALIFLSLKLVVLWRAGGESLRRLPASYLLGFLFFWPGMRLRPFLIDADRIQRRCQPGKLVTNGLLNMAAGLALIVAAVQFKLLLRYELLTMAVGLTGIALVVLFGLFDLMTAFWQCRGVPVEKQWRLPIASRTVAEYWSHRWNRAFHDFAREQLFRPLDARFGSTIALVLCFLFSGVLHDLAISLPARGGYGLPTLYFLLQAVGIWIERRFLIRAVWTAAWIKRLWTAAVVLGPLGLLLHQPFLNHVVLPQLAAWGWRGYS